MPAADASGGSEPVASGGLDGLETRDLEGLASHHPHVGAGGGKTRRFRFGLDSEGTRDVALEPGTILGDRYTVIRELGSGGMGRVYEAEHITLLHRVAIKVLRGDRRSPEYQARFRQEAEAASRVGHPAIVAVADFAPAHEGVAYMVMELLRGESLEDWLEQPGRLRDALSWLVELARGLHAAHLAGVVHRDLKPANLFLHRGLDGRTQPKILDFGIAKVATSDHTAIETAAGTVFGTPYYLAPERALGRPLDGRADLYSLGVVLYEVLTGTVPFMDASYMGVLGKHVKAKPLDPRQAAAERSIPDGVAQLTMALLAKDPNDRPADAAMLADRIEQCLRSEGDAIDRVVTGPRAGAIDGGATVGIDEISQRPTAVPGASVGVASASSPTALESAIVMPSSPAVPKLARAATRALGSNAMRDGLAAPAVPRSRTPVVVALVVVFGGGAGWLIARGRGADDAPTEVAAPPVVENVDVAPRLDPTPTAPTTPLTEPPKPAPRIEPAVVVAPTAVAPAVVAPAVKPIKRRKPKPNAPASAEPAAGGSRPPPLK